MNLIDKTISIFNPEKALMREKSRIALNELRSYDAAQKSRRTSSWRATANSANTENFGSIVTLRNRSRELVRNNSFARSAIDVICTNTIGAGILPNPKVFNYSKKPSEKETINTVQTEKQKSAWRDWADTTICDFNGRLTFYGIQKQAMRAVAESGECIIRKRKVKNSVCPLGIQLQILESDFLDVNKTISSIEANNKNPGGYIMQGIEFDNNGKRVAYWLYENHPGDYSFQPVRALISKRFPAEEVIHIFNQERPGQERGIPFGVSSFLRLYDFSDYEDAQLIRQKIAACFAVFIEDNAADITTGPGKKPKGSSMNERVEPGIIEHVPAGKKVAFGNPPGVQNYDEYSRKMLQGVAAAYGISYEALTKDLSNVTFSSGRMGWLEFQRNITDWQLNIIIPACNIIYNWFYNNGIIAGLFDESKTRLSWTPPRRTMIDPVKETTGITNQVRAGILTPSEAVRQQGYEFDDFIAEYQNDLAKLDAAGIILDTDMRHQTTQTVAEPLPGAKTGG